LLVSYIVKDNTNFKEPKEKHKEPKKKLFVGHGLSIDKATTKQRQSNDKATTKQRQSNDKATTLLLLEYLHLLFSTSTSSS
jgi:hypothetical protein